MQISLLIFLFLGSLLNIKAVPDKIIVNIPDYISGLTGNVSFVG